jgi:hypothetical protein
MACFGLLPFGFCADDHWMLVLFRFKDIRQITLFRCRSAVELIPMRRDQIWDPTFRDML